MIAKSTIRSVLAAQRKQLDERPAGYPRELVANLPYIIDRPLLIGGIRGCGRSTLIGQLSRSEYAKAWHTDFSDPRLTGFDADDFRKLDELIAESGRGVLLFDEVDAAASWQEFLTQKAEVGYKIIATVSLPALRHLESSPEACERFVPLRLYPFSYNEFLESNHKGGGENSVAEYLSRGAFPEQGKGRRPENLLKLYEEIVLRDVILRNGIRDTGALQRLTLHLMAGCGEAVSANRLRDQLRIKAVSTVTEYFEDLEQAGLISLVPVWSDSAAVRNVNPRKVYAADGAMAAVLAPELEEKPEKLFENMLFCHLQRQYDEIYYTTPQGGCDFVLADRGEPVALVQGCRSGEFEELQAKTEGLLAAMEMTGLRQGTIVTPGLSDKQRYEQGEVTVTDADTFLSTFRERL